MKKQLKIELISTLKNRFDQNPGRHAKIRWSDVEKRLQANDDKLSILANMEDSGGEPDVIGKDSSTGEFIFCDCSAESPSGRRSLCYDQDALDSRKKNKPGGSALGMAKTIGVELLDEEQYRVLQTLGEFDQKTSSWVKTTADVRRLGGALFCDRRYNQVFLYHNGAESYYASRGFRGQVKV